MAFLTASAFKPLAVSRLGSMPDGVELLGGAASTPFGNGNDDAGAGAGAEDCGSDPWEFRSL